MPTPRLALPALLAISVTVSADIASFDAVAEVNVNCTLTNTVNNPNLFQDSDFAQLFGQGSAVAVAGVSQPGLGTSAADSSISLNSSASALQASASFGWSGNGEVTLENPQSFKQGSSSAGGSFNLSFEVTGAPARYDISFTTGGPNPILVTLSGGGVSLFYCQNDQSSCPFVQDTLPRSGVLPPGTYTISASVSAGAIECFPGGVPIVCPPVPSSFNSNFNLSLSLDATPSFRWISQTGGAFGVSANWESNLVPTSSDAAIVDLGGQTSIDFTAGGASCARLLVRGTTLDLFGGLLQLNATNETSLAIGNLAQVSLQSGEVRCHSAAVGDLVDAANPTALLSVIGTPATGNRPDFVTTTEMLIGSLQPGRLEVVDGRVLCDRLQLVGSGATATATFRGATGRAGIENVDMGVLGPAILTAQQGATLDVGDATLGVGSLGPSTLVVEGQDAASGKRTEWFSTNLNVGSLAAGEVLVRQGGELNTDQLNIRPGKVTVDGITGGLQSKLLATLITVGGTGPGELIVENGGRMEQFASSPPPVAAIGAGGALRVRGQGTLNGALQPSSVEYPELHAGVGGAAVVELAAQARMILDRLTVGDSAGGSAAFTINGAELEVNDAALIFGSGSRIDLSNAARAHFALSFGLRAQQAEVNVVGPDSFVTTTGVAVIAGPAANSTPQVSVSNGGVFSQESGTQANLQIGDASGPGFVTIRHPIAGFQDPVVAQVVFEDVTIERGRVLVEGAGLIGARGTLTVRDRLEVDTTLLVSKNVQCGRLVIGGNGVVRCCPNGTVQATTIINDPGARIEGNANFVGTLVTGGLIQVGCSPGTLTVEGDFEQTATGLLEIEVGGLEPGQFDVVEVSGATRLDGKLEIRFLDGFLPRRGDQFAFLQVDGEVSGGFAEVSFPNVAPGFQAELRRDGGSLVLAALNDAQPGDGALLEAPPPPPLPAECGAVACGGGILPFASGTSLALLGLRIRRRCPR